MHEPLPHPRLVLALALFSVLIGRGLAQALPGTAAGIGPMIEQVALLGAVLSQLGAALLAALAMRSAALLLFTRSGQPALKLVSAGTTAIVVLLTLFAALLSHNQLAPHWSMFCAVTVAATLAWAGASVIRTTRLRALGLLGILCAAASMVHVLARIQALLAAQRASTVGFSVARGMATGGFALELSALIASFFWLTTPKAVSARAAAATGLALAPAIALGAANDSRAGVILERLLAQLSAHPDPLIPRFLRDTAELWALAAVCLCVFIRSRPQHLMFVCGLCLLGRSSADIPLGALFLVNAALALQLHPHASTPRRGDSLTSSQQELS